MHIADAFVILNPVAGGARRGRIAEVIERELAERGIEPTLHVTTAPGDAGNVAREAVAEGRKCIVAAGGDGTIGDVAAALVDTDVTLGVVPLGTGNAVGRELGLPLNDAVGACGVLSQGSVRYLDVGRANGVPFLVNCGVGFDAEVARRTDGGRWKKRFGNWAFVGHFMWTLLTDRRRRFRITVDGEVVERDLWAAVACNGRQYSWRLAFTPGGQTDDGLLHLVLFEHRHRLQLLQDIGTHWMLGGKKPPVHMSRLQGREIRVEADPPARWQADGDAREMSPVDMEIHPRALRVLVSPD